MLKMEETSNIFHILEIKVNKGENTTESQNKDLFSVWRKCSDLSNVSKVVGEDLCWRFLAGQCFIFE